MSGEGIFPSAEHECSMSYYEIPWTLVLTLLDFRSNKKIAAFSYDRAQLSVYYLSLTLISGLLVGLRTITINVIKFQNN